MASNVLRLNEAAISDATRVGEYAYKLVAQLYPLPRSITGRGLRDTLSALSRVVPLEVTEIPSGTSAFDWTVPPEWNLTEAYLEDHVGDRIVDAAESTLHVVGYSTPVDLYLDLDALQPHLHSLPDRPDWIPYRTSYYSENWGFCLADRVRKGLRPGRYRAVIRSTIAPGALTLGEFSHRGESPDEVLVFAHTCHPSLCNDNLSGVTVAAYLAEFLSGQRTHYSYRFVFAPATIGSIVWLSRNETNLDRIKHGLVLSLLGDSGPFHYKRSRSETAIVDRAAAHSLRTHFAEAKMLPFSPWGYDERQFCSPGIDLPMGRLTRTPNGEFPQYHTSADDLTYVNARALGESWLACLRIFETIEQDARYRNLSPKGEPQLGRRGLYRATGGYQDIPDLQFALLWVLNQSDGSKSLLDIAERSGLKMDVLSRAAEALERVGLLARCENSQIA